MSCIVFLDATCPLTNSKTVIWDILQQFQLGLNSTQLVLRVDIVFVEIHSHTKEKHKDFNARVSTFCMSADQFAS